MRDKGSGPYAERRSKDHRMNGSRPPAGEPMPRFPHFDSFPLLMSIFYRYQDDNVLGWVNSSTHKQLLFLGSETPVYSFGGG